MNGCQSFTCKPLSLNVSPLKPGHDQFRQTFANDLFIKVFPIKLLRYTVYMYYCNYILVLVTTEQ